MGPGVKKPLLEDEFRVFVSARIGPETPEWIEFWEKGGCRAVHSNARLQRELLSDIGLLAPSPYGYYHHFGEILDPTISFEISFLNNRAGNAPRKPARKAGVLAREDKVPRETDSLLERDGFEPSVPG